MTKIDIFHKIKNIFEEILDEIEVVLAESTTAEDVEEWDSLTHIQIITEIEKQFAVRFSTRDIEGLKNIGDMITLISSKLG